MPDFDIQTSIPLRNTFELRCLIKSLQHILNDDNNIELSHHEFNICSFLRDSLEKKLVDLEEENKKKK